MVFVISIICRNLLGMIVNMKSGKSCGYFVFMPLWTKKKILYNIGNLAL